MCARRAASRRPLLYAVIPFAVVLSLALSGCDAVDPHVPAVVRVPASALPAPSSPALSPQAAVKQSGLAPPVMHTVD